jgi:hypothetical protein
MLTSCLLISIIRVLLLAILNVRAESFNFSNMTEAYLSKKGGRYDIEGLLISKDDPPIEETNVNVDAKLPLVGVNVSLAINKTNDTLTVEVPKPVIPVIEGVWESGVEVGLENEEDDLIDWSEFTLPVFNPSVSASATICPSFTPLPDPSLEVAVGYEKNLLTLLNNFWQIIAKGIFYKFGDFELEVPCKSYWKKPCKKIYGVCTRQYIKLNPLLLTEWDTIKLSLSGKFSFNEAVQNSVCPKLPGGLFTYKTAASSLLSIHNSQPFKIRYDSASVFANCENSLISKLVKVATIGSFTCEFNFRIQLSVAGCLTVCDPVSKKAVLSSLKIGDMVENLTHMSINCNFKKLSLAKELEKAIKTSLKRVVFKDIWNLLGQKIDLFLEARLKSSFGTFYNLKDPFALSCI